METSSAWAAGLQPVHIDAHPPSFITFFPGRDATPATTSWAPHFAAAQPPITRLPAWCRVAVEACALSHRTGLIMKRISLHKYRSLRVATPPVTISADEAAMHQEARRVRPRHTSFVPSNGNATTTRDAPSRAEVLSSLMKAKVAVANHYFHNVTTAKSAEEMKQSRTGRYFKMVPRKRRLPDENASMERDEFINGNRFRTYRELATILRRASASGAADVDISMASSAEASAALTQSARDPRVHLAAQGVPDLSVISDVTELPESPIALPNNNNNNNNNNKSPVKKLVGHSSPVKTPTKRLADSIVHLLPGSSPKASPSPTKSSTPSTPFKESSLNVAGLTSSPAGFPKSPVLMRSPLQQQQQQQQQEEARSDSPPLGSLFDGASASAHSTPTKPPRPSAATPSRMAPMNPYHMFSPSAATPSRGAVDSPVGLMASLPSFYKSMTSPARAVVVAEEPMSINFGLKSPSFTHAPWLHPPVAAGEIQRSKNVSKALRRRSEPLARSLHKAKIRKRSMSPQKTSVEGGESPEKGTVHASLVTLAEEGEGEGNSTVVHHDVSEIETNSFKREKQDSPTAGHGIVEIDTRRNLDIFGSRTSPESATTTPTICSSSPLQRVKDLAGLAEDRCDGDANVVISRENGRLVVRFKLPTKYAWMFPGDQGSDEVQFSPPPFVDGSLFVRSLGDPESDLEFAGDFADDYDGASHPSDVSTLTLEASPSSPTEDGNMPGGMSSPLRSLSARRSSAGSPAARGSPSDISFPELTIAHGDTTTIPGMQTPSRLDATTELPAEHVEKLQANSDASAPVTPLAAAPPFTPIEAEQKTKNEKATDSGSALRRKRAAGKPVSSSPHDELSASSKPIDDSPGREYMREFIKRSRPKRRSTSNSPRVTPRQPLVVKSPNADGAPQPKRKHESEEETKKAEESTMQNDENTAEATATATENADPDADELGMEFAMAPATRRSSRLQAKDDSPCKRSAATPARTKAGTKTKATLSSLRSEQHDLSRQTIANTRRNKGKAVSAKRALERLSEEKDGEIEDKEGDATLTKNGKNVVWKEPLTAYSKEEQGEVEPRAVKGARGGRGRGGRTAAAAAAGRVVKPAPGGGRVTRSRARQ